MKNRPPVIIYSAAEADDAERLHLRKGRLSYIADGSRLLSERLPTAASGDIMIVSMEHGDIHIAPALYDECRRRGYTGVFLDLDGPPTKAGAELLGGVCESLARRVGQVYVPEVYAEFCARATPVASCAVSGGLLTEYLERLVREHRHLALAIPRIMADFSMPSDSPIGHQLTSRELSQLQNRFDADIYYSPQMLTNYFTYSAAPAQCRFVLFDDARSISEKIKLSKSFGISDIFLSYREIHDIAEDIIL